MSGGHVFVVHSDLTRLACDAWLLPAGEVVRRIWWDHAPAHIQVMRRGPFGHVDVAFPPGWGDTVRTVRFDLWTKDHDGPQPWLTHTGGTFDTPLAWYLDGLRAFLHAAWADVADKPPRHRRERPLLAVPLVGSGLGGAEMIAGEVVRGVLDTLWSFVVDHPVDVALVLFTPEAFAATQAERRRHASDAWGSLPANLIEEADELAALARRRELVLFLGAGVSVGAGLPAWDELLTALAAEADIDHADLFDLRDLKDNLDRARILARRLEADGRHLGDVVCAALSGFTHHSLTHSLLAGLPVSEVATTNYDTLFEQASEAAGRSTQVIPYRPRRNVERWVLKLHGSLDHPEDIVLTRDDYLRYGAQRQALAGIVQAMLMTRSMLFVGFSLADDNFHRIADEVRRAMRTDDRSTFGKALLLREPPLFRELWEKDIDCVTMGADLPDEAVANAARRLEIFLDRVLMQSSSATRHLLDFTFRSLLTDAESKTKDALRTFVRELERGGVRGSPVWDEVVPFLEGFGWNPADH